MKKWIIHGLIGFAGMNYSIYYWGGTLMLQEFLCGTLFFGSLLLVCVSILAIGVMIGRRK